MKIDSIGSKDIEVDFDCFRRKRDLKHEEKKSKSYLKSERKAFDDKDLIVIAYEEGGESLDHIH